MTIYPGMIGATLEALFGDRPNATTGLDVLHRIHPQTKHLTDEEQYGYELVPGPGLQYLQWEVSKLEAHRDSLDVGRGQRILKVMGGR